MSWQGCSSDGYQAALVVAVAADGREAADGELRVDATGELQSHMAADGGSCSLVTTKNRELQVSATGELRLEKTADGGSCNGG
jgi:hypothetical protein